MVWVRMKWIISATSFVNLSVCSYRYFRQASVPTWCRILVYKLVTSMVTNMASSKEVVDVLNFVEEVFVVEKLLPE